MVDPGIVRSTLCGAPSQRRPKSLDHEAQDLMRNTRRAVGQMGAHKSWRYLALRSVPGHSWLGASDERPWDYLRAGFAKRGGAAVVFYSRTVPGPWIVFGLASFDNGVKKSAAAMIHGNLVLGYRPALDIENLVVNLRLRKNRGPTRFPKK